MKHLLSIDDLSPEDITKILARANHHFDINNQENKKQVSLEGRTLINLFVETSTRTLTSFELAAKRLGMDVININIEQASIRVKGETIMDTVTTLNAMHPDFMVIRQKENGFLQEVIKHVDCGVINAGDGTSEHPTQALIDAATIYRDKGKIEGLNIAICGDVLHSRVARSNIKLLTKIGANVRVIAPKELLPEDEFKGIEVFNNSDEGMKDLDIVMMLRLQKERMEKTDIPSEGEFYKEYGMTTERLALAKSDCKVMHPGPINRGVEITSEIADDKSKSLILNQVEMGVPIRQTVLEFLSGTF